jgi:uroporphyrinogen-III decarboxylase
MSSLITDPPIPPPAAARRRDLSPRQAIWAKIRGEPLHGIPFATYNLHGFARHGTEPSYQSLLEVVTAKAGMLVKHDVTQTTPDQRNPQTGVETAPGLTRRTTTWQTPKGRLRSVTVTPTGQPGYTVEHVIKSDDDLERVQSVAHASAVFDLTPTRQLVQAVGEHGVLYVSYPDPMYSAATLFDYQDFVVRCITAPERLQGLIDYLAEGIVDQVERLASACEGLPLLFYTAGPEVATPPMLPPSVFRRFVTPYQRRLVDILHAHGHRACIHCHGRVRQVLDEMLEIGADALEPIEPPDQGDISLRDLLERTRGKLCLMGYIQDQEFYRQEPGLLRRRVEQIAAVTDPSDRYVMTPTCTPFQFPAAPHYIQAYREWLEAAAELLP